MSNQRDERGWQVEASEFENSANRQRPGQTIEVNFDAFNGSESIDVSIEEGSSYMRQTCNASIPIDVIIAIMRQAGYAVSRD